MMLLFIYALFIVAGCIALTNWLEKQKKLPETPANDTTTDPVSSCTGTCSGCNCSNQVPSEPAPEPVLEPVQDILPEIKTEQPITATPSALVPDSAEEVNHYCVRS